MSDDGPGWEMQEDNERQRWEEEQVAMNRCRQLTRELRDETKTFEHECDEHHNRMKEMTL